MLRGDLGGVRKRMTSPDHQGGVSDATVGQVVGQLVGHGWQTPETR